MSRKLFHPASAASRRPVLLLSIFICQRTRGHSRLFWILPVLLLLFTLPAMVQAQFTYTTNNGVILISGYTGSGGDVTIPSTIDGLPINGIADYAFNGNVSLTHITILNGMTSIGNYAFLHCMNLIDVTLPRSITDIGTDAFLGCANLTEIAVDVDNPAYSTVAGVLFNKAQTTLIRCPGNSAGSYLVPNTVTNIGDAAFAVCANLNDVTIPSGVLNIGIAAFNSCSSLTNVTLPNTVTNIGCSAFAWCTNLTNITIPGSVASIGDVAFYYCTSLGSIYFQGNAPSVGASAFNAQVARVYYLIGTTGWGPTFGGAPAFVWDPVSQMAYWITNGAITIMGYTGAGGDIIIPGTIAGLPVTSIGNNGLTGCNCNLTSVAIPSSVTNIEISPFFFALGLRAINVDPRNSSYCSIDGVLFNKNKSTLIAYPCGKAGDYVVPDGVTRIEPFAFALSPGLNNVIIPSSVRELGQNSFAYYFFNNPVRIYFEGNAPIANWELTFVENIIVYYLPGTTGWGTHLFTAPTALWFLPSPVILTTGSGFGIQGNGFGFTISWATNASVVVEASTSTDLSNPIWSPLSTNTLIGGSSYFSDPQWTNYPARFYRLRWP
jgi:BspA type Leucine rich repeat region (6 copies)